MITANKNEEYIEYDFFDKIDNIPNYIEYVIASDTDSEYILVPFLDFNDMNIDDIIQKSYEFGNDINTIILDYNRKFLLPKLGISEEYDFTEFKNELVADAFLTINAKKNYAYRQIIKNKNTGIYDRKIKFKGIATVRNDFNELTKKFIFELIYSVIFNNELETNNDLKLKTESVGKIIYGEIIEAVNNFEYIKIGKPTKWSSGIKDTNHYTILAAKLFNTLIDDTVLVLGSNYLTIPIKITDKNLFLNRISSFINKNENYICNDLKNFDKLTNLGIPYEYNDIELLKNKMKNSSVVIDIEKIKKNVIYCETGNKIINCIKDNREI